MKVKKSVEEIVLPASPSKGGVMQLSNSDKAMPRFYISLVIFFNDKPKEGEDVVAELKASLAKALALFYPCAGRLREKGGAGGELEIECNDAGALFVEAWVDASFSDFSPTFEPHPDFALLVPPHDPAAPVSSVPPVLAQMTHFECGHATLGIRISHSVCDALSVAHFLSSWSILTHSKDTMDHKAMKSPFPLQPYLDRFVLNADPSTPLICDHPEYQAQFPNFPTSLPPSITKLFSFTPSYIDALKEKAKAGSSQSLTRFEALAAHLWRGINIVRGLPPDQEIRLGISTDGRRRFNPPLPEGFFGNAIFFGFISTKAKDVVDNSFSYAADQVKNALANVSDEHMRSALNWYEKQATPKSVFVSFWRPLYDVAITSWWRFPLYDLDFGWGKPSYVRFPIPFYDGVIFLLPSPLGPGHVDALIDLQVEHMPKFEAYINDV